MAQVQGHANENMNQQGGQGEIVNNVYGDMANNQVQQQEEAPQGVIAITTSAMVLWDYAQTIVRDHQEQAQTHPHGAHPPHPPVPMSRRNRCILTLIIEGKRDELRRLWRELDEIEALLGLEFV